ncbi:MAG TPA: GlsB/YeaQ/YmgE family stress response membrane protein [Methylomirabilota bacterium]|nr:GlsB/YeaQ/YmgE family stress response membrane protein [Methylomirabilota bacterium]
MNPEMFGAMILIGLLTGWLAGFVMKDGGYGLIGDFALGLLGSSTASAIWALGVAPTTGNLATAGMAFLGATVLIVAQRKVWYVHA